MATKTGVWNLQQVRDKQLQSLWSYAGSFNETYEDARGSGGELWVFGSNSYGELGQNSQVDYSSPVQIPGSWSKVTSGKDESAAVKTDGTLWVWGRNNMGQLGQNAISNPADVGISSPIQVPGTTWAEVQCAWNAILAKKTDGTLWTWGDGWGGASGQNSSTLDRVSSPVQIGSDTTWNKINRTPNAAYAIKTDGTLWAWGNNPDGKLGQNNRTQYSSPVQIPGTTWDTVSSFGYGTMAIKTTLTPSQL